MRASVGASFFTCWLWHWILKDFLGIGGLETVPRCFTVFGWGIILGWCSRGTGCVRHGPRSLFIVPWFYRYMRGMVPRAGECLACGPYKIGNIIWSGPPTQLQMELEIQYIYSMIIFKLTVLYGLRMNLKISKWLLAENRFPILEQTTLIFLYCFPFPSKSGWGNLYLPR